MDFWYVRRYYFSKIPPSFVPAHLIFIPPYILIVILSVIVEIIINWNKSSNKKLIRGISRINQP